MNIKHDIYLNFGFNWRDNRPNIFSIKSTVLQILNMSDHQFSFTRTENQILKILELAKKQKEPIILYTIVDENIAKYLEDSAKELNIPCFSVLGDLILNFSKLLKQRASHIYQAGSILWKNIIKE